MSCDDRTVETPNSESRTGRAVRRVATFIKSEHAVRATKNARCRGSLLHPVRVAPNRANYRPIGIPLAPNR